MFFSLILSSALAETTTVNMDLSVICTGACKDIKISYMDEKIDPVAVENNSIVPMQFEIRQGDLMAMPFYIELNGTGKWAIGPVAGAHTIHIDNTGRYPLAKAGDPSLVVMEVAQDFHLPDFSDSLALQGTSYLIAECWYVPARGIPGTSRWDWTIEDKAAGGCHYTNPLWKVFDRPGAIWTIVSQADFKGDERKDTTAQAGESGDRGRHLKEFLERNGVEHAQLRYAEATKAGLRKAEVWVTFDSRVIIPEEEGAAVEIAAEPPVISQEPVDFCGYIAEGSYLTDSRRRVDGDRNLDGVYNAKDCQAAPAAVAAPPADLKLRWELHGGATVGLSGPAVRGGAGFFLPVTGGDLHLWADAGITTSAGANNAIANLWNVGPAAPVASWGGGLSFIAGKPVLKIFNTLGVTGEGLRLTTGGQAEIYDFSAVFGGTYYGKKGHGFISWTAGGGVAYGDSGNSPVYHTWPFGDRYYWDVKFWELQGQVQVNGGWRF